MLTLLDAYRVSLNVLSWFLPALSKNVCRLWTDLYFYLLFYVKLVILLCRVEGHFAGTSHTKEIIRVWGKVEV